jgi:hypothetical protein
MSGKSGLFFSASSARLRDLAIRDQHRRQSFFRARLADESENRQPGESTRLREGARSCALRTRSLLLAVIALACCRA